MICTSWGWGWGEEMEGGRGTVFVQDHAMRGRETEKGEIGQMLHSQYPCVSARLTPLLYAHFSQLYPLPVSQACSVPTPSLALFGVGDGSWDFPWPGSTASERSPQGPPFVPIMALIRGSSHYSSSRYPHSAPPGMVRDSSYQGAARVLRSLQLQGSASPVPCQG